MKNIIEWIKILKFKKNIKPYKKYYNLVYNDNLIEKATVVVFQLSIEIYKLLINLSTPQYDKYFLMRNKKGFNTIFFQQNYDVIVCDKNFRVIKTFIDLSTGFVSEYFNDGYFIYFSTVGTINHLNIKKNDILMPRRSLF